MWINVLNDNLNSPNSMNVGEGVASGSSADPDDFGKQLFVSLHTPLRPPPFSVYRIRKSSKSIEQWLYRL